MDEIQARLSSAMHTEDLLNNDILKLSNENLSLKNQCDSLKLSNENYLAEKRRADELDKDNTEMKIQLDTFIGKEVVIRWIHHTFKRFHTQRSTIHRKT